MSRLKILNLLLFLLSFSLSLVAQKSIRIYSLPMNFTFRFVTEDSPFSGFSNEMIAVIAEDAIKHPRRISFTFHTEMKIRMEASEGRNPMTGISFGSKKLTGNLVFRKFPMAAVMIPTRVAFVCRIGKKDSSSFFDLPETSDVQLKKNDSLVMQFQVPRFSADSDTIVFRNVHFYFDQDAIERFRERVTLINDYYASDAILDSLGKKIREVDLGKINRYPGYFIILEELNKILAIIKERNFSQRLELDSIDPMGFQAKFSRLSRFSLSSTMTFRENLKMTENMNSSCTPDSLVRQFLDGMLCYIRWSMLVTERNSKIYHEYLERYFSLSAFGNDIEVIRNLAVRMFPGQDPDSSLALISMKINKAYHERADELMNDQQYAEAVELLRNAGDFSKVNPYLKGTVNNREIITKAANGIYDSYLGVADGAIRYGKPEMARSYMVRAQNYRKEHAAFVTSDSLFNRVFEQLVEKNLSRCDTLYAFSAYTEALECYQEFEKGFDSLTLSLIHRGLEVKMQFCRYQIFIGQGKKNLADFNKPDAGLNFFLARQLSEQENYYPDPLLDSLCKVTYPFYLIHLLYAAEDRIWSNRLEMARKVADSIAFLQRTTGVGSSRELSDALAGYRRKMEERICWNASEPAEVFLLRSERERELKEFMVAAALNDSAVFLIRQNPDCLIPATGLKDTIRKYSPAADFQKMQQNADLLVRTSRYEEAISGYRETEQFYSSGNIRYFGLECMPMYDYVREKSRQELTIQAFLFFKEKNDVNEAFRYLKLLRLQDYPRKDASPFMEWLGKEFAGRDFHDQPDKDPVALVRDYTGSDKWMKSFRIAYYSQTQKLRHKPDLKYFFRKLFP